jgi:hypothetical protein
MHSLTPFRFGLNISITVVCAHKKKGHGATFVCPISKLKFVLSVVLFVDDCDLIHIDMINDELALQTLIKCRLALRVGEDC